MEASLKTVLCETQLKKLRFSESEYLGDKIAVFKNIIIKRGLSRASSVKRKLDLFNMTPENKMRTHRFYKPTKRDISSI